MLSSDEEAQLRRELAVLDAELDRDRLQADRYGVDTQNDQFLRELGLREYQTQIDDDYRWSF